MGGLSTALLREHKWGYLGAFASAVLASALVTGSMSLLAAANKMDGVVRTGLDAYEASRVDGAALMMAMLGGMTAFVAVLVSVILVSSTMAFVVQGRRRELALLRLSGASRGQVRSIIRRESLLLGLLAGLVGSAFGVPIGRAYVALFGGTYGLPEGFTVFFHPETVAYGVVLTTLVTMLGASGPARRISRVQPVEALSGATQSAKPMSPARWALGAGAAVAAVAMFLLPADLPPDTFVWAALGQGVLALVALVQLAPIVVSPIAHVVCSLVGRVSPGAGVLAQGHAGWDRARTASLANPALLLLAVPGIFFTTFLGLGDAGTTMMGRALSADIIAEHGPGPAALDLDALSGLPGVAAAAPVAITRADWFAPADPNVPIAGGVQLGATDLAALAQVQNLQVTGAPLDQVTGTRVAVSGSAHELGERTTLTGPDGSPVEIEVVTVIDGGVALREYLVDAATFDLQGGHAEYRTWFIRLEPDADKAKVMDAVGQALPGAHVQDAAFWTQRMTDDGNRQVTTSLLVAIGGSCLLAVLAIGVSLLTSLRERQAEFALSRRAGATQGLIHRSTLIETVAVLAIGFGLGAAVIAVAWGRLAQNFAATGIGTVPGLPFLLGWFVLAGSLMALVATVGGTSWALRSIRME